MDEIGRDLAERRYGRFLSSRNRKALAAKLERQYPMRDITPELPEIPEEGAKRSRRRGRAAGAAVVPVPDPPPRSARGVKRKKAAWVETIEDICRDGIPGYDPWATASEGEYFDEAVALLKCQFIETYCQHVKGEKAGQAFILERWQRAIVGNLFGWVRADGTRRYREALLFVPRKNGKSVLCAALADLIFFTDGEMGAEVYCVAAERDQATLVWDMAKRMIEAEPKMASRCTVYPGYRSIMKPDGSVFKPVSSDAGTKHGFNVHACFIDELHAIKKPDLLEAMETGTVARAQPLIVYMTTSDTEGETSCNEKHSYATKVRDQIIADSSFLPIIYEAAQEDDWKKEETWAKANPNYGVSVKKEYMERQCRKAMESSAALNSFLRLNLNVRTQQDIRWISMESWDACPQDITPDDLEGGLCFGGLDLASTSDLTALALYFPDHHAFRVFGWVPKATAIRREERNRAPYLRLSEAGALVLTDGNVIDYDFIREEVLRLGRIYNIAELAIDRWNSTHLQTQLMGEGVEVIPFGQGFRSMSAPTKELEKLVLSGQLRHFGDPLFRWCASNVMVEVDAVENMKPSKKASPEKIDVVVAAVMALGRAMVWSQSDESGSVYEGRGIITL